MGWTILRVKTIHQTFCFLRLSIFFSGRCSSRLVGARVGEFADECRAELLQLLNPALSATERMRRVYACAEAASSRVRLLLCRKNLRRQRGGSFSRGNLFECFFRNDASTLFFLAQFMDSNHFQILLGSSRIYGSAFSG